MRPTSCRRGFTFIESLFPIAIILVLAAAATPNFSAARRRSNPRACFANRKTIAGAIEMYNLDYNTNVARLTPKLARLLEVNGYLQQYPLDPGGRGQYRLGPESGNGVYCTEHGPIQGPRPDAWKARRQGTLEQELDQYSAADVDWLIRRLREQSEAELRRARREAATIGAMLTLGTTRLPPRAARAAWRPTTPSAASSTGAVGSTPAVSAERGPDRYSLNPDAGMLVSWRDALRPCQERTR